LPFLAELGRQVYNYELKYGPQTSQKGADKK